MICGVVEGCEASGAPSPFWDSPPQKCDPSVPKGSPARGGTEPQAIEGVVLLVHVATCGGGGGASPLDVRR